MKTRTDQVSNKLEVKAMHLLEEEYDNVVNIGGKNSWKDIGVPQMKRLNKQFNEDTGLQPASIDFYFRTGVPDILAYSWTESGADYKFVEVKKSGSSVRETQVLWMSDFSELNSEIWYIDDGREHRLLHKLDAPFIEDKFFPLNYEENKNYPGGYRKVQQNGSITLPKEFRDEHDLESGDKVYWKRHSKNHSKLIIEVD